MLTVCDSHLSRHSLDFPITDEKIPSSKQLLEKKQLVTDEESDDGDEASDQDHEHDGPLTNRSQKSGAGVSLMGGR